MSEVSSVEAARIIGVSDDTIRRYVKMQLLPARQEGLRGRVKIELRELRKFAEKHQFRYDEALALEIASN